MAGVWAGLLVYVLPRLDFLAAAADDALTGAIGVLARGVAGGRRALAGIQLSHSDAAGQRRSV